MYQFIVNMEEEEFQNFANQSKYNHFTKSVAHGKLRAAQEGYEYHLLGVKKENVVVATAMLLVKKIRLLNQSYGYISYGYNLDYDNKELLSFMNQEVIAYGQRLNLMFLRVDSNVWRQEWDNDGNVVENGFNNEHVTAQFVEDGFIHRGYNYGYSGNWLSRFTYILDISKDQKDINKGIRYYNSYTRRNKERGIVVRELGYDGIDALVKCSQELAKEEYFRPKSAEYIKQMLDFYGDNAHLYVASANLSDAYRVVVNNRDELQNELDQMIADNASEGRLKEQTNQLKAAEREVKLMEEHDYDKKGHVDLGAELVLSFGDKAWDCYMYSIQTLPNFRASFALHTYAIADLKAKGIKYYDFEGISGDLSREDPYFGLNNFKRSFGGDYTEFLGEFDYVYNAKKTELYLKMFTLKVKVERNLIKLKNKIFA